jgi:2-polyprenyl-3-methyl-5-hydroxy-6-metoxy-1,4-benzoquinol methylase
MENCEIIKSCLSCDKNVDMLMDLGHQPLANNFHDKNGEQHDVYPLRLMFCKNCYHCQLSHSVNPSILFKNYKYVSGTTKTGLIFFRQNAEDIIKRKNISSGKGKILDIACNDGSQLDFFKEFGWETYGVDPAENICPIAQAKGHRIICDFWNENAALQLPVMDVIVAQNVFAHTQHVNDFLKNCKHVMNENTSLFIQTSQKNMIINGEFDTTYHEHISFFNTRSMNELTRRNGLTLNRVSESEIHGGSYIFEIKLSKDDAIYNVDACMQEEETAGLYSDAIYEQFNMNAISCVQNLKAKILEYESAGYKCIGFGAAAKGQTVLCYGDVQLDYIIDENPLKIGQFSPKMNIPVLNLEYFENDKTHNNYLIVILAWNFASEIKQKIEKIKGNKKIVLIEKYFPDIHISHC